jgi:hypothetical protein
VAVMTSKWPNYRRGNEARDARIGRAGFLDFTNAPARVMPQPRRRVSRRGFYSDLTAERHR